MHPGIVELLEGIGVNPEYQPDIEPVRVHEIISDYEGLIIRDKLPVDNALLEKAGALKFIVRAGAGIEKIDLGALERRGIQIVNTPEGNRDALAEHAVGMLLSMLHNISRSHGQVRDNLWVREENRGVELGSLTVGIIGYGYMGEAFSRRLAGFGCKVFAYDKYKHGFDNEFVTEVELETLHEQADIVSFHIPQNEETFGLVDKNYLNKFQKEIYLMNTARGGILNLGDLRDLIIEGRIKGAALDVLENEDIKSLENSQLETFSYLRDHPSVIITPHIAGWTYESYRRINEVVADKIQKLFAS